MFSEFGLLLLYYARLSGAVYFAEGSVNVISFMDASVEGSIVSPCQ